MELQVALDRLPLDRAVHLAADVAPHADWVEVGTSLLKQYGLAGVREVVAAARPTPVLVDTKTADDVEFELSLVAESGARGATVLGLAPDTTLDKAVQASQRHGLELVVDLLGVPASRVDTLADRLPRHVRLAAHVGKDAQAGTARAHLELGSWAEQRPVAVAGGLGADGLASLSTLVDVRAIVGSAVTTATDPVTAVRQLREAANLPVVSAAERLADEPASPSIEALSETVLGEVRGVLTRISGQQVVDFADVLHAASRVLVTGEGRSGLMARAFAMRLMHLGVPVHVIGETTTPAVAAGDTVVAVSGSGTTAATLRAAEQAHRIGAAVHAVTTDVESPLAAEADAVLHVPAATKHRRAGEATTVQPLSSLFDQATHVLFDVVCLHLAETRGLDNVAARRAHANTE